MRRPSPSRTSTSRRGDGWPRNDSVDALMSHDLTQRSTVFARTNFRDQNHCFGIYEADRRAHMYVIGKTGTGKSTLLEVLIDQDIRAGRGLALIDPHGDLVDRVPARIPAERAADVIDFNAPDFTRPLGFNP